MEETQAPPGKSSPKSTGASSRLLHPNKSGENNPAAGIKPLPGTKVGNFRRILFDLRNWHKNGR